jgi:hypothetical protein
LLDSLSRDAQDNRAEAAATSRSRPTRPEVEEDLPPRTAEILHRRQWRWAAS